MICVRVCACMYMYMLCVCVYVHNEAFLAPGCPHAMRKPAQSPWLLGRMGKRANGSELDHYVLQPSLGSGIATHNSDYPCPLPRQCSERSYRCVVKRGQLHVASSPGKALI